MVKSVKVTKPRVLKDKTAVPITNGPAPLDRETFHYHLGAVNRACATVEAHKKVLKDIRRAAQDSGINLGDLDRVIRMREEEPEPVQESIRRLALYAQWTGLAPGIQGDLFVQGAAAVDEVARAEEEGHTDGIEGVTAAGDRYDAANPIGQARMKGWHRGQKVVLDRFAAHAEQVNSQTKQ